MSSGLEIGNIIFHGFKRLPDSRLVFFLAGPAVEDDDGGEMAFGVCEGDG